MARESMLNKRKQKEKNKAIAATLNVLTGKNETKFVTNTDTQNKQKTKIKNVIDNLQYDNVNVKQTRTIKIGPISIKTTATKEEMDNAKRAAYHLRLDTLDKINKCAKLSGLKKAELVDIILNNELTNILNKIENK